MDLYEALKSLHVLMAVVWVGGATTIQVLAIRATRAADPPRLVGFLTDIEWVGTRIYLPASLILVATGFGMVGDQDLPFEGWIIFGLVVWIISAGVGSSFLGPESGRIGKIVEAQGPDSPEATARIKRIFVVSRIELLLLVLVIIDMVVKPGT